MVICTLDSNMIIVTITNHETRFPMCYNGYLEREWFMNRCLGTVLSIDFIKHDFAIGWLISILSVTDSRVHHSSIWKRTFMIDSTVEWSVIHDLSKLFDGTDLLIGHAFHEIFDVFFECFMFLLNIFPNTHQNRWLIWVLA